MFVLCDGEGNGKGGQKESKRGWVTYNDEAHNNHQVPEDIFLLAEPGVGRLERTQVAIGWVVGSWLAAAIMILIDD